MSKNFDDYDMNHLIIWIKNLESSIAQLWTKYGELANKLEQLKISHDNLVLNAGVDDF